MKKVILSALLLLPLSLFAQKFGHFDSSVIVKAMPEYAKSQTELQNLSKQFEDDIKRMQDELQKKGQEYDRQHDSLPDNVKKRREEERLKEIEDAKAVIAEAEARLEELESEKDDFSDVDTAEAGA